MTCPICKKDIEEKKFVRCEKCGVRVCNDCTLVDWTKMPAVKFICKECDNHE